MFCMVYGLLISVRNGKFVSAVKLPQRQWGNIWEIRKL